MSTQEERLTAIANAIREKDGSTGLIPASDFAARILAIKTGSDFAVPLVVTADAGAVVTAVNGETILTATANENDAAVFSLEKPGEWSIEASLDGRTLGPKTVQVTDQYEAEFSFVESRLPKGYAEVEYIQSGAGQYIATGFAPTSTTKIVMDIEPLSAPTSTNGPYFFYSRYTYKVSSAMSYVYDFNMRWSTAAVYAQSQRSTGGGTMYAVSTDVTPRRMIVSIDNLNKIAAVNDETKTFTTTLYDGSTYGIRLLSDGTTFYPLNAKLYSCQMYDNDVPVRDFVPCIDPSGAVGLYDLVNDKFYASATSAPFTAGPAI